MRNALTHRQLQSKVLRELGLTWKAVGKLMGVSKQAASRHYTCAMAKSPDPEPIAPDVVAPGQHSDSFYEGMRHAAEIVRRTRVMYKVKKHAAEQYADAILAEVEAVQAPKQEEQAKTQTDSVPTLAATSQELADRAVYRELFEQSPEVTA